MRANATVFFQLLAIAASLTGCDDGSGEKARLEEKLAASESRGDQQEERINELFGKLKKAEEIKDDAENIRKLAKDAHTKLQDLNSSALEYPMAGSAALKQSAGTLLLMRNEAARVACEELYKAIDKYQK